MVTTTLSQAQRHFHSADNDALFALVPRDTDDVTLARLLGMALRDKGDFGAAETLLKKSFHRSREAQDLRAQTLALLEFGALRLQQKNIPDAQRYFEQALHFATQLSESTLQAQAHTKLADLLLKVGNPESALPLLEAASAGLENNGPEIATAELWISWGNWALQEGDFTAGEENFKEAQRIALLRKSRRLQAQVHRGLGELFAVQQNFGASEAQYLKAEEAFSRFSKHAAAEISGDLAYAQEALRKLDGAQTEAERAWKYGLFYQDANLKAKASLVLGKIARRDFLEFPQALVLFQRALGQETEVSPAILWECHWEIAEIERQTKNIVSAQQHYQAAIAAIHARAQELGHARRAHFLQDGKLARIEAALEKL